MLSCVATIRGTEDKTTGIVTVSELSSDNFEICHNKSKFSCPGSSSDLDHRLLSCGFNCPPETKYKCIEDRDRGVLEFCVKPEICEPGMFNLDFFCFCLEFKFLYMAHYC